VTDAPTPAPRPLRLTVDEISPDADDQPLATLVTDDGKILTVPLDLLPPHTRTGSTVTATFTPEEDETERRKRRIRDLQRRLFG
jgi:hypothetical protein